MLKHINAAHTEFYNCRTHRILQSLVELKISACSTQNQNQSDIHHVWYISVYLKTYKEKLKKKTKISIFVSLLSILHKIKKKTVYYLLKSRPFAKTTQ